VDVVVTSSARFAITPEGRLWSRSPTFGCDFWTRYLDVFDRVRLVVRANEVSRIDQDWRLATGANIEPYPLPYYEGPIQFLVTRNRIRTALRKIIEEPAALLLRLPCPIAVEAISIRDASRPFGAEVIGDPFDTFAPGSVKHPLRPLLRWWLPRTLRRACTLSSATSYVTEHALQSRYPPRDETFTTHYSSLDLPHEVLVPIPRSEHCFDKQSMTIIFVGTLAQLYKGPDVLLDAFAEYAQSASLVRLLYVGEGQHQCMLEHRARQHGLADRVLFRGQLPAGDAVYEQLDAADLFVLPSYQEGLPRAMIEAMARGSPCIGSTVGGFSELLPKKYLVPPGNPRALAARIKTVLENKSELAEMSATNLVKARDYERSQLRRRRKEFYTQLKELTLEWIRGNCPCNSRGGMSPEAASNGRSA
jgi:glycosyltransferase involved in cell wall biosynthesis